MKTTLFIAIALMLLAGSSFAQSDSKKDNSIGFYIGPNFADIDIQSPELSVENHSGHQVGLFYRQGSFIYGQAGLEYLKLQTNLMTDSAAGAVDIKRLQVPLYGGINLLNFSKKLINVRACAGPTVYYTLNAPSVNPEFSTSDFSRLGINGTIGGGVDVLIFSLDAGYTFGLTNLLNDGWEGKGNYAFVNVGLKF